MIINSNILDWCAGYEGERFHALFCDPPYEFGFMGWDWDKSGIAFSSDTWRVLKGVLHDGAFGMAFASSRGWHRLAIAIEDAGFIIHPSIFGWVYGSGFPKATNIANQIMKMDGGVCDVKEGAGSPGNIFPLSQEYQEYTLSEDAKVWEGHRYGLQALKPAIEPVVVFQKPYVGKAVDCIVKSGAGALNIDGGRIGSAYRRMCGTSKDGSNCGERSYVLKERKETRTAKGRFPANFFVDEYTAGRLDVQSGVLKSGGTRGKRGGNKNCWLGINKHEPLNKIDPSLGGASRFFFNVEYQIDTSDPVYYCGKASKKERNLGCEALSEKEVIQQGLAGEQNNPKHRNNHPTVKPIKLATYLSTLLLPPDGYAPRRILVPFAGVGSEVIGCETAGWDEVVGVELSAEYCEIAEARIKYWRAKRKEDNRQLRLL